MSAMADRLYTAEQVRRLDACAIDEHGMPGYTLMKRAGVAVFEAARTRFTSAQRWVVLCGAGNNAGDGYVVARLAAAAGLDVRLIALKPPETLSGDAATAAQDWLEAGGRVRPWPPRGPLQADLIIDALLGSGLDRVLGGDYRKAVEFANRRDCPVVAVDIPTGIHADTGQVMGAAIRARLTVSFIGQKRGLYTNEGPDHCGELLYDDLGTPPEIHCAIDHCGIRVRENILSDWLPPRRLNAHKGDFGHVMVAGGDAGMSGAVRLAGEAALRSGAGLVTLMTHPGHAAFVNLGRPELMVVAVEDTDEARRAMQRATVLAVGPGLGQGAWGRALLAACLDLELPLVVDADGLNLLARAPACRGDWVLTPHPAEAARLLDCSTADIQADRVGAAIELAKRYKAVAVLKGCGTIIANHDARYAVCPLGNPGMATAGSGDVLTGVVAGLLGQGLSPWQAAQAGVVAHAAAGDAAAAGKGQRGLIAGDITEALPGVLRRD